MKIKAKISVLLTAACLFPYQNTLATESSQSAAAIEMISAQSEKLQAQMAEMQEMLIALQKQQQQLLAEQKKLKSKLAEKNQAPTTPVDFRERLSEVDALEAHDHAPGEPSRNRKATEQEQDDVSEPPQSLYLGDTQTSGIDFAYKKDAAYPYGYRLLGNLGGTAVITSPFIHSRYDFRGTALIVNYSSVNKDLSALRQRKAFFEQMDKMGLKIPNFPLLELSGEVEGSIIGLRTYTGRETSSIDVTDAEMDIQALVNPWFTGFMTFAFDNSPPANGGSRVSNSRLYMDNGFITVGNLTKSPFYLTIGQYYMPFGQFDSYLITNPIDKTLFRVKARGLTLAYATQESTGATAAIFTYQDDTRVGKFYPNALTRSPSAHINTVGANLGYTYQLGPIGGLVGGSYISNVADSLGMQATGGFFPGFGYSNATEVIQHRVPGGDLRAEFFYEPYSLIMEYASALREFSPFDATYNGDGARPSAYHVEGVYSFDLFDRPSSFVIGYDESYQALVFNVPKRRYSIALNSSIWRNTLFSIEYRHDINYTEHDYATGDAGPVFIRSGKISNAITGRFDIYF